jgi:hypothetical protein
VRGTLNSAAPEDLSALQTFADDMRREVLQK